MSSHYVGPLANLITEFQKMPGIGPKSAQRLAFYILGSSNAEAEKLSEAIKDAKKSIRYCSSCFNITVTDPCEICLDAGRDKSRICVVADPKDVIAIEKTRDYRGLYHVLGGVISPLDGVGPDNLRVKELLSRLNGKVEEIILATNPTVEGETTNMYLTKLIKPLGLKLTRIAYGLPMGSDMDFADEVTLCKAFEGRREVE